MQWNVSVCCTVIACCCFTCLPGCSTNTKLFGKIHWHITFKCSNCFAYDARTTEACHGTLTYRQHSKCWHRAYKMGFWCFVFEYMNVHTHTYEDRQKKRKLTTTKVQRCRQKICLFGVCDKLYIARTSTNKFDSILVYRAMIQTQIHVT